MSEVAGPVDPRAPSCALLAAEELCGVFAFGTNRRVTRYTAMHHGTGMIVSARCSSPGTWLRAPSVKNQIANTDSSVTVERHLMISPEPIISARWRSAGSWPCLTQSF